MIEDECRADDSEGIECKRVTIKFIPVLENTWRENYNENKGKFCRFIVNSECSSVHK